MSFYDAAFGGDGHTFSPPTTQQPLTPVTCHPLLATRYGLLPPAMLKFSLSPVCRTLFSVRRRAATYSTTTPVEPFNVAIVGSGPAGFYTALRLLERLPATRVDMFEALPVPFGLSRFGVAPDHPEVKVCQDRFTEVANYPGFKYVGNTEVGRDVGLADLKANYHAVVLAYGSHKDRLLGIAGEDLPGVFSAREFVGWYNGLPEHAELDVPLDLAEDVTIVGNGNVALDVARILLADVSRLKSTDITEQAYEKLKTSKIKRVRIAARRGILQSAFTTKEVRELINEPNVYMNPIKNEYLDQVRPFMSVLERTRKRLVSVLEKNSKLPRPEGVEKTWNLDYLISPIEIKGSGNGKTLESTTFEVNNLVQSELSSPAQPVGSGQHVTFKNELVFRSIGYKSVPLVGMHDSLGIQFDQVRGIVPNIDGRVSPGVYAVGWVKTGPTGVIAHTMGESFEIAENLIDDYKQGLVGTEKTRPGFDGIKNKIKSRVVNWGDWEKIDAAEKVKGSSEGKPREKFTSVDEMLKVLE